MNVDDYLNRINSLNFKENSVQNLFRLQQNHLLNVPFENLDVHLNKKVRCNLEELYEKVILKKRGGKLEEIFEFLKAFRRVNNNNESL